MKIINIEGIDAVGKETVSKALEKTLNNTGYRVMRVSFPIYDGNFGKSIKDVLMGKCGNAPELDHDLISVLYTLDRIAYFRDRLEYLKDNYDYLICDRSFYSNFMYQAAKLFINNPNYYNCYTLPIALLDWTRKNYKWEFEHTGLADCELAGTFVLQLSEEDSIKQLGNRFEKDTNETDRDYLKECKKFINLMMSDNIIDHCKYYVENYPNDHKYLIPYLLKVTPIKVKHEDDPNRIPIATQKTVDAICEHLGLVRRIHETTKSYDIYCSTAEVTEEIEKRCNTSSRVTTNDKPKSGKLSIKSLSIGYKLLSELYLRLFNLSSLNITNLNMEYAAGNTIPHNVWYTLESSGVRYFKLPIDSDYLRIFFKDQNHIIEPFPYDVMLTYDAVNNRFTKRKIEENSNEN